MAAAPTALAGKRVTVMGLGQFGGGVGVARFLAEQGAKVVVTDKAPADKLRHSMEQLAGLPITFHLGGHDEADFSHCDLVVASPAVDKAQSPYIQAAMRAEVPITSEMNLFLERCPAFTVGVTGSVGKSTTTMLIYLALQAALGIGLEETKGGGKVYLGGNIGKSLLSELRGMTAQDVVVLELSSFMLEETPALFGGQGWSPNIAVVTNLFPNHLDRHGTLELYASAKQNLLRFQKSDDVALLNGDHEAIRAWASVARGRVEWFSSRQGPPLPLLMPGEHNQSNARAALAVVAALPRNRFPQVSLAAATGAITGFKGLSHRLQLVHVSHLKGLSGVQEVRWYNDSKATTPEASLTALRAFIARVTDESGLEKESKVRNETPTGAIFIVGGYDKHIDMSGFEEMLARHAAGVLGIGQTGQTMVGQVASRRAGALPRTAYVGTLAAAQQEAWKWLEEWAKQGVQPLPAVVLSPASASWGQFQNYEERGEQFAKAARLYP